MSDEKDKKDPWPWNDDWTPKLEKLIYRLIARKKDTGLVAKAYVNFTGRGTNGACTLNSSFNVTGVSRTAAGKYTITWDTDFTDAHYVWVGSGHRNGGTTIIMGDPSYAAGADQTASVAYIACYNTAGSVAEPGRCRVVAFGS
jgi:hypothetical protein